MHSATDASGRFVRVCRADAGFEANLSRASDQEDAAGCGKRRAPGRTLASRQISAERAIRRTRQVEESGERRGGKRPDGEQIAPDSENRRAALNDSVKAGSSSPESVHSFFHFGIQFNSRRVVRLDARIDDHRPATPPMFMDYR